MPKIDPDILLEAADDLESLAGKLRAKEEAIANAVQDFFDVWESAGNNRTIAEAFNSYYATSNKWNTIIDGGYATADQMQIVFGDLESAETVSRKFGRVRGAGSKYALKLAAELREAKPE